MTKVLSLRVPDELAAWAETYAKSRGVTRQALCEQALVEFKEACEGGVPDIEVETPAELMRRATAAVAASRRPSAVHSPRTPDPVVMDRQRRLNAMKERGK